MTKFRHLIWMMTAAVGLMLSASHSYAQQPDLGDQPGLIADDSYELDPEWQKQMVLYRTTEPPGTIIISTAERHLYLVQPGGRALRYGIGVGRDGFQWQGLLKISTQGGVAGLDAAARDDRAPALSAALHGRRPRQSARRARACISAPRSIAFTAPTAPDTIGTKVSSGCFRLVNADVADLYDRVPVGTKVVVRQKPEL